jgi:hypothetical protein
MEVFRLDSVVPEETRYAVFFRRAEPAGFIVVAFRLATHPGGVRLRALGPLADVLVSPDGIVGSYGGARWLVPLDARPPAAAADVARANEVIVRGDTRETFNPITELAGAGAVLCAELSDMADHPSRVRFVSRLPLAVDGRDA